MTTTNDGMKPPPAIASDFRRRRSDLRAAHRDRADLDRRAPYADRDALAVLAAGPDPVRRRDVVTEHDDFSEDVGPVADQVHPLQRRGDLAVFDEIALRQREDEVT